MLVHKVVHDAKDSMHQGLTLKLCKKVISQFSHVEGKAGFYYILHTVLFACVSRQSCSSRSGWYLLIASIAL